MSKIYIGIDPGKSGGIGFINQDGDAWAVKNDSTYQDLFEAVEDVSISIQGNHSKLMAVIEEVHSSPQMGVKSAFSFGQSFGSLLMLLTALKIPHERVRPQRWQKTLGCMTGGDKNVSKRRAQELFPSITITHAIADALLLAEYARRIDLKGGEVK